MASPSKMKRPAASLAASALKNGGQDDAEPKKKNKVVEGRLIPQEISSRDEEAGKQVGISN